MRINGLPDRAARRALAAPSLQATSLSPKPAIRSTAQITPMTTALLADNPTMDTAFRGPAL